MPAPLKIKVGGLMFMTTDIHAVGPKGRTETMIPLVRKTFGDRMALYADANGFYSVEEAIRVGRLLEEYRYGFFEEPVMFDWHEETKQVADALSLPIAGGEQEYSLHGFRWLIANDAVQIVQPDNYYFGGMIRSMQVARMAAAFGKSCTPHMSGGGLGFLYMMHFVSALPNATPHHEFKGLRTNVQVRLQDVAAQGGRWQDQSPNRPGLGRGHRPGMGGKAPAGDGLAACGCSSLAGSSCDERPRAVAVHRRPNRRHSVIRCARGIRRGRGFLVGRRDECSSE